MSAPLWIGLALLLALPSSARSVTEVVELAEPGARAQVAFRVPHAVVEVVGAGGGSVRMQYGAREPSDAEVRLPIEVQGNRVEVAHPGNTSLLEVRLEVPRRTDLLLETSNGGRVRVVAVDGAIEIVNSNAGVELEDVGGSIAVSTSNGPILAQVTRLDRGGTVSLVTSNGPIELVLPGEFQGRLLAESDTGPVESEFRVQAEQPDGVRRPGRVISGRIGSGHGRVRLRTNNAGIRIRRGDR